MMTEATGDSNTAATQRGGVVYARTMMTHVREELRFADTKASSLFAIIGTSVGVAAGAAVALSWSPARLVLPVAIMSWIAIVSGVVSVVMTGAAAYPRTGPGVVRTAERVAYFGDVVRCDDIPALRVALDRSANEEYELLAEQLLTVSRTAAVKYRLIRGSLWTLLVGGIAACAAAVASAWIGAGG